MGSVFSQRFH